MKININMKQYCQSDLFLQLFAFATVSLRCTREPAYGIFVLGFRPKKQQFSVALPTT